MIVTFWLSGQVYSERLQSVIILLFYYDCCLTILILFGNKFDQINDENYIYSIARYYYIHYWDRHLDDKPPFVGFTAKYDLQIATLVNRKSL